MMNDDEDQRESEDVVFARDYLLRVNNFSNIYSFHFVSMNISCCIVIFCFR